MMTQMTIVSRVFIIALLLASMPASSEPLSDVRTLRIPVTDSSGAKSPLTACGDVSFHEELSSESVTTQLSMAIKLTNVSNKPILAYEIAIDAVPDLGGG